ncbi:MAG: helix-turn-helix domain-containing protein [Geobacteraceae bacterium]|nr:helix-turn-helix domain-containing protein [Geobacteraceae bacterium]
MSTTAYKKTSLSDWHRADIKAALEKKGHSFASIARKYGYVERSPNMVLHKPWPAIERIVGKIIGVKPALIWPSRYDCNGHPLVERTTRVKKTRTTAR